MLWIFCADLLTENLQRIAVSAMWMEIELQFPQFLLWILTLDFTPFQYRG